MQRISDGRVGTMADGLVTVAEAARFLSCGRTHLYGLMDAGELQYVKLGRARRIPRRALVDLAERALVGPERGVRS